MAIVADYTIEETGTYLSRAYINIPAINIYKQINSGTSKFTSTIHIAVFTNTEAYLSQKKAQHNFSINVDLTSNTLSMSAAYYVLKQSGFFLNMEDC